MFLKISQNSQENTCVRISFLIRLHVESWTFIKQGTPAQVFTFKFCKVFKNSSFIEHLWWLLLERAKNCDPLWIRYETMNPKSQGWLNPIWAFLGFFGATHRWRGVKKVPLPKICHTYPAMMKLGTVTPYLRKIQKIYKSSDTPYELCLQQHLLFGNQQLLSRNADINCI